jgi:hypothetical protein
VNWRSTLTKLLDLQHDLADQGHARAADAICEQLDGLIESLGFTTGEIVYADR